MHYKKQHGTVQKIKNLMEDYRKTHKVFTIEEESCTFEKSTIRKIRNEELRQDGRLQVETEKCAFAILYDRNEEVLHRHLEI